jgi:hypothetical protein
MAIRPNIKHDGVRRRPDTAGEIVGAMIKMAICVTERKKPDQEPGLYLFSEENRGDR